MMRHRQWAPYHACGECGAPAHCVCRDDDDRVADTACPGRTRSLVRPGDSLTALRRAWTDAHAQRVGAERTEKAARARLDEAIERQKEVKA